MRNKGTARTVKTSTIDFLLYVDDPAYLTYLQDEEADRKVSFAAKLRSVLANLKTAL